MMMDMVVKIPQEKILEAAEKINKFKCLRKEINFELWGNEWITKYCCDGYGNGYGIGMPCTYPGFEGNCDLRITNLNKCIKACNKSYQYLIQPEYQNKR